MRLDYFVAHATGYSRKQVKQLIASGAVRVAGVDKPKANTRLQAETVWLHGEPLSLPGQRYLMLNKPAGVVCSTEDPAHRTVLDLLPAAQRSGLMIVGRLDRDTTGLVLLTTDGQWSHGITSPSRGCSKTYRVTVADPVGDEQLAQLRAGVALRGDDAPTLPAEAESISEHELRLTIREGRYHQIKRMLGALGNRVVALHRERVGPVWLDPALAAGQVRALTEDEIAALAR